MGVKKELPCLPGAKLYSIINDKDVTEYEIEEVRIDKNDIYMSTGGMFFSQGMIGKYYFFTKEEAEEKFKEFRGL